MGTQVGFYAVSRLFPSWNKKLSGEDLIFYSHLYKLIVLEPNVEQLSAFLEHHERDRIYEWINCNVVVVDVGQKIDLRAGVFQGLNLCQRAVKNYSREVVKYLIGKCGADLSVNSVQITVENDENDYDIEDCYSCFTMILNEFHDPVEFLRDLFNDAVSQNTTNPSLGKTFTFDFALLCPNNTSKQMNVLNTIVNSSDDLHCAQYELLKHPLIETFLHSKWTHYRKFFFLLVFIHSVFVLSFSWVAYLMALGYQSYKNSNATLTFTGTDLEYLSIGNEMVCLSGSFLFMHAIIQISFLPLRKLIWELELLLNLIAASGSTFISIYLLIFSSTKMDFYLEYYHLHHIASWLVLIIWTNLMLLVGRLPQLGCYSLMMTTVTKNFLKVMISFIFLIIGFALSFTLIFPMSEFFTNPWNSFVRTVVMMIGEFEYTSTYSSGPESTEHSVVGTSRFIFLIFLITCSIILMNLTQGIAVNDIKLLQDISQEIRVEKETRFLYELERVFTHPLVVSNRLLRHVKRLLYDTGSTMNSITIGKNNRNGLSMAFYDKLVREF